MIIFFDFFYELRLCSGITRLLIFFISIQIHLFYIHIDYHYATVQVFESTKKKIKFFKESVAIILIYTFKYFILVLRKKLR